MGRIDSIESPHLRLKVPLPDAPPFLIGVYKGKEKSSDLVLEGVMNELLYLSPDDLLNERQVYCRATAWIADAVEKAAVCGIVSTSGTLSCPRCEERGIKDVTEWQRKRSLKVESKHNHVYFAQMNAPLRTNEKWSSYLSTVPGKVLT